jgi:hypothetical protein
MKPDIDEHMMMTYSHFGYKNFMLLLGYKAGLILARYIDPRRMVSLHRRRRRLATMAIVPLRTDYGATELSGDVITNYVEKPWIQNVWVNGGRPTRSARGKSPDGLRS